MQVLHEGARRLGWLLVMLLALSVWWPRGVLRRIDASERLQMAVSALVALAMVSITKNFSSTSCPWDLAEFGGVARYASHWALGMVDGGWPVFPRWARLCGVCIFGWVLCVAPPSAARCTLVACRSIGSGVDSWRSPAGSRGALHEPHALDGVDLLDHRMALRTGGIGAAPTLARFCQYKAARGI